MVDVATKSTVTQSDVARELMDGFPWNFLPVIRETARDCNQNEFLLRAPPDKMPRDLLTDVILCGKNATNEWQSHVVMLQQRDACQIMTFDRYDTNNVRSISAKNEWDATEDKTTVKSIEKREISKAIDGVDDGAVFARSGGNER